MSNGDLYVLITTWLFLGWIAPIVVQEILNRK